MNHVDFTCDSPVNRFIPAEMKNKTGHLVRVCPIVKGIPWRRWRGDPRNEECRFFSDFRPAWKGLRARLKDRILDSRRHDLRGSHITYRLAAGIDPNTVQDEFSHRGSRMTMDCYGRALRDPGVGAWATRHFRFPFDPAPQSPPLPLAYKRPQTSEGRTPRKHELGSTNVDVGRQE